MTGPDLSRAVWRKSSHSESGGGECVEVACVRRKSNGSQVQASECVEIAARWRKGGHSDSGEGTCVEVSRTARLIAVRDSKNPDGPVLAVTPGGWHALLTSIKHGDFA